MSGPEKIGIIKVIGASLPMCGQFFLAEASLIGFIRALQG